MKRIGLKRISSVGLAFTLLELLVVFVIIAVLAGIGFAVMSSSQRKAKAVRCISNLRQLGIAFSTYSQDHNGNYPPVVEDATGADPNETVWSNVLITEKYLPTPTTAANNMFLCPFDPGAPFNGAEGVRSYAYNSYPTGITRLETDPLIPVTVNHPSTTILLAEWYFPDPFANPESAGWDSPGWAIRTSGGIYKHHPDGTSGVLFYDLHVACLPAMSVPGSSIRWSFEN